MTIKSPYTKARGIVREGSLISPATLVTSHQPAYEKNDPTTPTASASIKGFEPDRCATKGTKFDQLPFPAPNAQITMKARNPTFKIVSQRTNHAPRLTPRMFASASTMIARTATI